MREIADNFRTMAENAHDGIVVLKEEGRACYANKKACEIAAYSRSELTRADFKKVVPRIDDNRIVQIDMENTAGSRISGCIETKLIRKQGRELYIELSVSRTIWDGEPAWLLIFRDVTKRKCAEESLINSCAELKCRIENRNLQLKNTARELAKKRRELKQLKIEGEKISNELMETNTAISILARNINKHRLEAEKIFAGTIDSKIMPIVENLREKQKLDDFRAGLDILEAHLQTLAKELMGEANTLSRLTPSEMQIATMIRNGLNSREIAERCFISLQTVKTHRRNIRKKLNIHAPAASLSACLRSLMD